MMERKIYLLLTDTGTVLTRLIKLYTKQPYNHVSIALDSNLRELYSFGRTGKRNPFSAGFVQENIHSVLFRNARCAIYSCSITESQFRKLHNYIRKIDAQKDQYRFNLLGIIAIPMNKKVKRKNAFFCSQFIATLLKECEIIEFKKPLSLITPHDILETSLFKLVYQGNIKEYIKLTGIPLVQSIQEDPNIENVF